jgi:hypothetical protein
MNGITGFSWYASSQTWCAHLRPGVLIPPATGSDATERSTGGLLTTKCTRALILTSRSNCVQSLVRLQKLSVDETRANVITVCTVHRLRYRDRMKPHRSPSTATGPRKTITRFDRRLCPPTDLYFPLVLRLQFLWRRIWSRV